MGGLEGRAQPFPPESQGRVGGGPRVLPGLSQRDKRGKSHPLVKTHFHLWGGLRRPLVGGTRATCQDDPGHLLGGPTFYCWETRVTCWEDPALLLTMANTGGLEQWSRQTQAFVPTTLSNSEAGRRTTTPRNNDAPSGLRRARIPVWSKRVRRRLRTK